MPSLQVELSQFTESDIDAVLALSAPLGLSPWSRKDYLDELRLPEAYLKVARVDGKVAGFISARRIPGPEDSLFDAEIYNIGVSERYHRQGIGGLLMRYLLEQCEADSVQSIWLEVRENNQGAIAFYLSFGFAAFGFRRDFYRDPTDNALILKREMGPEPIRKKWLDKAREVD